MLERSSNSSGFPAANCASCGAVVLTHLDLDQSGNLTRRCVQCDRPIVEAMQELSAAELEERGYLIGAPRARKSGGCGGGCACGTRAS